MIRHAYPIDAAGEMTLQMHSAPYALGNLVTPTLSDNGMPFNPLNLPAIDTGAPLKERSIGGLGFLLIRRLADRVAYRTDATAENV